MPIYKFRDCYLNTTERLAIRDGRPVKLTPKSLDMLQLLIQKQGEVVSKDEILGQIWNGSFVEEGNLPVHISTLRRLFGENKNRVFIETVPGSGYRFVAPVHLANENEWKRHFQNSSAAAEKNHKELLLDSIAVLPLRNANNDPDIEYLVDGLTESFINSLSPISGLKVLGRNTVFRYKNKNIDADKVGETLGVAAVLTGRLRVVKDSMTISVELTEVATGKQLWGNRFTQPFNEVIEVQETIISAVAKKISSEVIKVAGRVSHGALTKNAESYRLYLKGLHFMGKWSVTDVNKSIEQFQLSIFHDPRNVHSYLRIVESYLLLYSLEHISYQSTCVKIQPLVPLISELVRSKDRADEIFEVVFGFKAYLDWDFKKSLKHLERAVLLNPGSSDVRRWYSNYLTSVGRMAEALEQSKQVLKIDPLSVRSYNCMSKIYYKMRQYKNALQYVNESLELLPGQSESLAVSGFILTQLGEHDEAIDFLNRSLDVEFNIEYVAMVGYIQARAGRKNEAYKVLEQLDEMQDCYIPSIRRAIIYGALGEMQNAFKYLDESFERHEADMCMLKVDPRFDPFRHMPRFVELMKRVGFPD